MWRLYAVLSVLLIMILGDETMKKMRFMNMMTSVVLAAAVLCACGKNSAEAPETVPVQTEQTVAAVVETQPVTVNLSVEAIEEQGDMMAVKTTFCQVKFPFAFADLIQVKAVNEEAVASLEFAALIAGDAYPLYALHFGGSEGIHLGAMEIDGEAEPRAVYAEFYPADEAALGDNLGTFHAAQETFNDVVASLAENQKFAQAE